MKNIMPKVVFKFDKEKDLWNNWNTVNYVSPWTKKRLNKIPVLDEMCKNKSFDECRKDLEKFCEKIHKSFLIKDVKKSFQDAWDKINDEFFIRLEKITGNNFPFQEIKAYLTTQLRCPYDYERGSFMISFFSNIPMVLKTSAHELMHLDFHNNNWKVIEKQIGKEKTADLKEALTVLLNLEFKDLWFVSDKGKDNKEQQKLREFIKKEWLKEKNYKSLLEKCVIYLKK